MTTEQNLLDAVYTEGAVTDAAELYDNWAEEYEADLRAVGYAAAERCARALASADPMLSSPIFDLGCALGLSGEALPRVGFKEIDGYDCSQGASALARKKDCYRELFRVDLAQPDSIPDRGCRHVKEEYGPHLPGRDVGARGYILRKC